MSKLLETYIKRCIIAEQHTDSSNIIRAIISKFPSEYIPGFDGGGALLARSRVRGGPDRQAAFWKRRDTDKAFRKQANSQYAYKKYGVFDFFVIEDEFREYLKPELKSAEVILVEQDKASALRISDVRSALEIAENVEEFEEMVRASI